MNSWTPRVYDTTKEKRIDFALGIGIWFLANLLMGAAYAGLIALSSSATISSDPTISAIAGIGLLVCSILPLIVNITAIIVLAIYRRWMAFGMLASFAVMILLALCAGVVLLVTCFSGLSTP